MSWLEFWGYQLEQVGSQEPSPDCDSLMAGLRGQISALKEGRQTIPWHDGLPAGIAASLAPYVDRLADLYCEGLVGIELLQKNKGFDFRG